MILKAGRSSRHGIGATVILLVALTLAPTSSDAAGEFGAEVNVGHETPATDLINSPLSGDQEDFSVAKSDNMYLVVWTEERRNGYDVWEKIYAARVSPNGVLLDPRGFLITEDASAYQTPDVSSNGDGFLVVWDASFESGSGFRGVMISEPGEIGSEFVVNTGHTLYPQVASDGDGYFVVWGSSREVGPKAYQHYVEGVRVSAEGEIGSPLQIGETDGFSLPDVAFGPDGYLIVWRDAVAWGRVLSQDGLGQPFEVSDVGSRPRIASGTDGYLVVWETWNGDPRDSRNAVFGAPIEAGSLTVGDASRVGGGSNLSLPSVIWNGTGYSVLWSDTQHVQGWRFTADGAPLESFYVADTESSYSVAFAGDDEASLAVWGTDRPYSGYDVDARLLDPSNETVGKSFLVTAAPARQSSPSIAWSGSKHVIAWHEYRGDESVTVAARFEGEEGVDGTGLEVAMEKHFDIHPQVESVRGDYLVLRALGSYRGAQEVRGTFFRDKYLTMYRASVASDRYRDISDLAVGTTRLRYLVVWRETRYNAGYRPPGAIRGAVVDGNGRLAVDRVFRIDRERHITGPPKVAGTDRMFLVVWGTRPEGGPSRIRAAAVTPKGEVHRWSVPFSGSDRLGVGPSVVSDGESYLLVWRDVDAVSVSRIRALLLDGQGTVTSAEAVLATSRGRLGIPKVAWDGKNYVVVWTAGSDIYGSRVSSRGDLVDGSPFVIADSPDVEKDPEIVGTFPGASAVAYRRQIDDESYPTYRVFFRLIEE